MKHSILTRTLALLLCLCLLPTMAFAVDQFDDMAVTRSDFTLSLALNADAFPEDGTWRPADWEAFLSKLSLRGTVDTARFLQPFNRTYMNAGLYLNDKQTVPFEYDGYYSFRYLRSPALAGESVFFQMFNFFEFMLKPYYFMDLPTQLIALLLYPEASYSIVERFAEPMTAVFAGDGTRAVSYADLYELCEGLDLITADDPMLERSYYYITSLLVALQASDATYDAMCSLETWLNFLDPEQEGMAITVLGNTETYELGGHKLLEKTVQDGAASFTLHLPNADGFALDALYDYIPKEKGADIRAKVTILSQGEESVALAMNLNGIPKADETEAAGSAIFTIGGSYFESAPLPARFDFRYSRDAAEQPYQMALGVDYLHPATNKAALTLLYNADMKQMPPNTLVDREYDNQDDFFHLNEEMLGQLKERFVPSLALAFFPFVLQMPAGAINDMMKFLADTNILSSLGIE